MSLQGIAVTLGVGFAAIAAIAYVIFNQPRYKTTNHNAYGQKFRVIRNDKCGVCLEEENWDTNILNCGHWIHGNCLSDLKSNTDYFNTTKCPFCRTPIY